MKPEELRRLLEKIISNATIRGQEITAAQWKHIDHEYSQVYYEEHSKAGAKELLAARVAPPHC
jgi:nucleoside diphosphate kinase